MATDNRVRAYEFILYPESAPQNWKTILEDLKVPTLVSPLHDKDIDPGTGELKKPHYHVILSFTSKKSIHQVIDMVSVLGIKYVDPVRDLCAASRYLCHLDYFDRPDKRLYDPSGVLCLNGVDYVDLASAASDRNAAINEMMSYILTNSIKSYHDFLKYCFYNERSWFIVLRDTDSAFFERYFRSLRSNYNSSNKE